jgi:predicted secreted protein
MTNATIGYDSEFAVSDGASGYTAIAEVVNIQLPGFSRDSEEATHLKSADKYKEFIAGMKEMQDASITLNWVPSDSDAVLTAFEKDSDDYQITAPNGVRIQFSGFFTAYTPPQLSTGKMEATATIKVTGKATILAAA